MCSKERLKTRCVKRHPYHEPADKEEVLCFSILQLIFFFLIPARSLIQYQDNLGIEKDVSLVQGASSLPRKARVMWVAPRVEVILGENKPARSRPRKLSKREMSKLRT